MSQTNKNANSKYNYIRGSAKEITFPSGGRLINVSLNLDDLLSLPVKNGYLKITVAERRITDRYGNTHTIYEDTFKPKSQSSGYDQEPNDLNNASSEEGSKLAESDDDDLPFKFKDR
jgi:hypothetical protein